jgi:23S rRNA pseudouridine1911/1915/1917 synthase
MRLDLYLQKLHPGKSRAVLQNLIKRGHVTVNGQVQSKNGFAVKDSDSVGIDYVFDEKTHNTVIELPILYEDKDCVVIDKPLGVLTHSKGALNDEGTVATWLQEREGFAFDDLLFNTRAGIVHRLDRATSGVMICAKNPTALKHLQKQFQDKKAKKTYAARIEGVLEPRQAVIDLPIERNPKQPSRFRVGQNGKPAQTTYSTTHTISRKNGTTDTILELKPLTGRTHQLRVHLNYMKHPIVGDSFYGGREADRLYLHAHRLEITLPSKERTEFTSKIPENFYSEDV